MGVANSVNLATSVARLLKYWSMSSWEWPDSSVARHVECTRSDAVSADSILNIVLFLSSFELLSPASTSLTFLQLISKLDARE